MDFSKLVDEILDIPGYTPTTLADELGIARITVYRLLNGTTPDPRWSLGDAVIDLHRRLTGRRKR